MNDRNIIELYFARNENAIAETSLKYGPYCLAVAHNILDDREDEEESLNDTWLTAWNIIPPQRPKIFSAFLAKITRNISLNMLKKRNAKKRGGNLALVWDELAECIPSGENIEESFERSELIAFLEDFINTLPKAEHYAFLRRYWFGDTVLKIAEDLHITESKARSMLSKSRKKLFEKLSERGFLNER